MASLPIGVHLCCKRQPYSIKVWRCVIFFFTLLIYTTFHASRKPISVVKSVLHPNCTEEAMKENKTIVPENATFCMWKPFDTDNYNVIFGYLDLAYLLSYAIGMFFSGHIAERMNLRVFLAWGCFLSGLTTAFFGIGYFAKIHELAFFFVAQIIAGFVQSSGWPAVVACMGNWFGKRRRGLILGIWNSHVSLGNILGSLLAGIFVEVAWGWSFFVPGAVVAAMGLFVALFLVPYPEDVGFELDGEGRVKLGELETDGPSATNGEITGHTPSVEIDASLLPDQESTTEPQPVLDPTFGETSAENEAMLPQEPAPINREDVQAISFCGALAVPGVIEYSLCLFFVKSTAYIFLFWLPMYLKEADGFDPTLSAVVSIVFDLGGIFGGIVAGAVMDRWDSAATTCVAMIGAGIPMLYVYYLIGATNVYVCMSMLLLMGFLIVGPYSLITTAVSADLGTHQSLRGNARALATVVAIIDGTGSLGAALGPCIVGLLVDHGWIYIFVMLVVFLTIGILCLLRRVIKEVRVAYDSARYDRLPLS